MTKPKLLIFSIIFALLLSACGSPSYIYIKNDADRVYLKLPNDGGWSSIDGQQLSEMEYPVDPDSATAEVLKSLTWSRAYDADTTPNAVHMLFAESDKPFIYLTVRHLTETQTNGMSLDSLRDYLLPVTEDARAKAEAAGIPLTQFELLYDVVQAPNGLHGIRVIFNYKVQDSPMSTFDLTAYLNNDNTILYLLLIRCTTTCYRARFAEFDSVASSLTINV